MDPFQELGMMALNATDGLTDGRHEATHKEIAIWQNLFSYTHAEAEHKLLDLSRRRVPEELWELVRCEKRSTRL